MKEPSVVKDVKNGTLLDLVVLYEYIKNLDKDNPFTLEGLATMKIVRQIATGIIKNINVIAGYNVAKKNEAIIEIVFQKEQEEMMDDEKVEQYYL